MSNSRYTYKDYKKDIKQIYKHKDFDTYKSKLNELYKKQDIKSAWKINELRKLLLGEQPWIDVVVSIASNLLAALATKNIDDMRTQGISVLFQSFDSCLVLAIILGLFLTLYTLALTVPFLIAIISSYTIEQRNYEIELIINTTGKGPLKSMYEKENKKVLLIKMALKTLKAVSCAIAATIFVCYAI